MIATTLTLAASCIFSLSFAAPIFYNVVAPRSLAARDKYVMFGGDGTKKAGWPPQADWMNFEDAWNANLPTIQQSCEIEGWGKNNDQTETQAIRDSIENESKESGIPKELILAVIMQESKGCVRVITTRWDFENPGLMQSAGRGTCNPAGVNKPITPCPVDTIHQMIHDGTAGEGLRTTLKNSLDVFDSADDSKWYKAARRYNAGPSMDAGNLGNGPTPCYASDIANRLINPFNHSPCNNDDIKTLSHAQGAYSVSHNNVDHEQNNKAEQPTLAPVKPQVDNKVDKADKDSTIQDGDTNPSDPIIEGAAVGCTKYYTPQSGETCQSAPVHLATLRQLNTQLNEQCTNLWAGYAYCVAA